MEVAQLNARIDLQVKREGDAALARAGVSATEAIRALWSYLAETGKLPSFMGEHDGEPVAVIPANANVADEGAGMALSLARAHGLATSFESSTYEELRDLAFDEMVSEGVYRV
jgi:antitoxin component of RelBE/YafQ-DinJ toxin-antitoxin module